MYIVYILLILLAVLMLLVGIMLAMYHKVFGRKIHTNKAFYNYIEQFDGLDVEQFDFAGNKGQKLAGCWYTKQMPHHALVVMAHGFGVGGHNSYMTVIDYFTSRGYVVLAYDATGCDNSDSRVVGSFVQGVADLDHAIKHAKTSQYNNLPIVLIGHSWGGYSVGSVLEYHPDVVACTMVSAVNSSSSQIVGSSYSKLGILSYLSSPLIVICDHILAGKYGRSSCIRGMSKSNAHCMVIHSHDDKIVTFRHNYQPIFKAHHNRPNTQFIEFDDRGHGMIFNTLAARQYQQQLGIHPGSVLPNYKVDTTGLNIDKNRFFEIDTSIFDMVNNMFEQAIASRVDSQD